MRAKTNFDYTKVQINRIIDNYETQELNISLDADASSDNSHGVSPQISQAPKRFRPNQH